MFDDINLLSHSTEGGGGGVGQVVQPATASHADTRHTHLHSDA